MIVDRDGAEQLALERHELTALLVLELANSTGETVGVFGAHRTPRGMAGGWDIIAIT